jgi:hypothetical protein
MLVLGEVVLKVLLTLSKGEVTNSNIEKGDPYYKSRAKAISSNIR